jgi:phage tail sheath gpL-like
MSGTTSPGVINFAEIPYTWKVPGNYMEVKAAINENAVLPFPARGLIIGQMLAAGQAAAGGIYPINSGAQANALFGTGSIAARMCHKWLKNNPYTPVDAMGIADATGATKASGTIALTGTATAAGTLVAYVAGQRFPVAVNVGDTAAVVAGNLQALLAASAVTGQTPIPIGTVTVASGTVTLNAAHGGTLGNQIDIRLNAQCGDLTPSGLAVTVTAMAGGATDPTTTIASALAGIATWYTDVAFAWTDTTNIGAFASWLNGLYGAMVKKDAQGYVALSQTYGTALTFGPNCKYLCALPLQNSLTPSWEVAAALAAACCYSTAQQPALQMRTVPLAGVVCPADADVFTLAERENLLIAGLSTYDPDGYGGIVLERVTTTYRLDAGSIQDFAWFDLQDTKVPTRVRYDWDAYISLLYPRNLLTEDGTIAAAYNPDAVTPGTLKASWTGRSAVYEQNGWIQNSAATAKNSSFAIDPNDGNRVNARQQIQVMGNLMVLAGSLEFISNN